jgi:hypothetical protein
MDYIMLLHYNTYGYAYADNWRKCVFSLFFYNIELDPDVTQWNIFHPERMLHNW